MQQDVQADSSPGLDSSVFLQVIEQGDLSDRLRLADQLAAFLANEAEPKEERALVVPAAMQLMADPEFEVRATLARGLIDTPDLDADLLFAIIADEDEIALPFLSHTPALSHWHMLAVLRVGDELRQGCVAMRPDVTEEAIDYIVDAPPLAIAMLLFENEAITLTPDHLRRLYARFGETEEMLETLLARPDLPLDVRITQAGRSAARLQQLLLERQWLSAHEAMELVADAEENAMLGILIAATEEELPDTVGFLIDAEVLTPSLVVRAACRGAMGVVAAVLSNLAGLSMERAEEMMFELPQASFRGLHSRAGLPESTYWNLQAACDVAREEREEEISLSSDDFGRRLIEVLLTSYEALPATDRPRQLDFVGRFAADRPRRIARRLKDELLNAA